MKTLLMKQLKLKTMCCPCWFPAQMTALVVRVWGGDAVGGGGIADVIFGVVVGRI